VPHLERGGGGGKGGKGDAPAVVPQETMTQSHSIPPSPGKKREKKERGGVAERALYLFKVPSG